jgi:hypothetical protein
LDASEKLDDGEAEADQRVVVPQDIIVRSTLSRVRSQEK